MLLLYYYSNEIPVDEYRDALKNVWEGNHRQLLRAIPNRHQLRAVFRRAQCDVSDVLPEQVTVFRGTSAMSKRAAQTGLAWTLDRDIACWFAMRFAERNGRPLVLRASVPRDSIVLHCTGRGEQEIICFDVHSAEPDTADNWEATLNQWTAGCDRYDARQRAQQYLK